MRNPATMYRRSITKKIMSLLLNKEEKIGRAYKCTAFVKEQINYCHPTIFVQQINTTAYWLTN